MSTTARGATCGGRIPSGHPFQHPRTRTSAQEMGHSGEQMVVLRATMKVLKRLAAPAPEVGPSDTALGDWYVNRIVVDRRPLLLLVSSESRLPLLHDARNVRSLPERLPSLVLRRLEALSIPSEWIRKEVEAMDEVRVASTASRSILGQMTGYANDIWYWLPERAWTTGDLLSVEHKLEMAPCLLGRAHTALFPVQRTLEVLAAKWGA